ncbi:MAG TPA: ABC transporter substrate-binding protein [Solirubrobacteraceae bacterium]|nr:ABC transporter substrate-binding protein [Solirubrobacteraceae bacterium]
MHERKRLWGVRRAARAAAACAACAVAVAACGGSGSGSNVRSITVGLPVVDATFIPAYLAQQEGYYKQQGLNVKLVVFKGGGALTKALVGGAVDIGINGLGGIMPAVAQGQPIKVIYGGFNEVSYQWVAIPSIKTVRQAAGKTWGVTSIGSDTDYMTRYILAKNGIKANIVTGIVSPATALAGFQSGAIQVAALAADNDAEVKAKGYPLIASESQYTSSYPDHLVYAQESFIKHNPQTITRFLRALSDAIKFEKTHPAATEAAIVKYMKIPPQYAADSYDAFVNGQYPDGRLPGSAGMNFFWSVGLLNGEYKQRIPESKWLDDHWIATYSQWSK